MGGHRHDRARPVLHQDVIGYPDRNPRARGRIRGVAAGEHAVLLFVLAFFERAAGGPPYVVEHLISFRSSLNELRHQRMLGSEREERCAKDGIGARREDRDVDVELVHAEEQLRALRTADPVPLHGEHRFRPFQERHVVEQLVSVRRVAEEPLLEVLRLDHRATPFAPAVDHLLVRQDGLVVRAPLDRCLFPVRVSGFEKLQEEPLRPPVHLWLVARDLAAPIDRPAHPFHLFADGHDVVRDDLLRMTALADRRVLSIQAERVVAHGTKNVIPPAPVEAAKHVALRVVPHLPHVQRSGRVRQHLQHVVLAKRWVFRIGVRRDERTLVLPDPLPLRLDCLWVVRLHRCPPETKKPLDREAMGSWRGRAAMAPYATEAAPPLL